MINIKALKKLIREYLNAGWNRREVADELEIDMATVRDAGRGMKNAGRKPPPVEKLKSVRYNSVINKGGGNPKSPAWRDHKPRPVNTESIRRRIDSQLSYPRSYDPR